MEQWQIGQEDKPKQKYILIENIKVCTKQRKVKRLQHQEQTKWYENNLPLLEKGHKKQRLSPTQNWGKLQAGGEFQ